MSVILRRLLPLFIAKFLLSFVFWYAIEKAFMRSIGFDDGGIGVMAAVYATVAISMEVPSGILADRWSRKGVMIIAAICLSLSSWAAWVSHDPSFYILSPLFWGLFEAMASGTGSAMLYDALQEEQGHTRNYHTLLGRFEMIGGVALIAGALLGGVVSTYGSLRSPFLVTALTSLVAIVAIAFYRDTASYKSSADAKLIEHTKGTFRAVLRNPRLFWLVVMFMAIFAVNKLDVEFYQLWYLAMDVPAGMFGFVGACIEATFLLGGALVKVVAGRQRTIVAIAILAAASAVMIISRSVWLTVVMQSVIGAVAFALTLALGADMQEHLPSKYRAGAGSVLNTVGRVVFIPVALIFGYSSKGAGVLSRVLSWWCCCLPAFTRRLGRIARLPSVL